MNFIKAIGQGFTGAGLEKPVYKVVDKGQVIQLISYICQSL